MSIILSRDERMYVQVTLPWAATIPNSGGTPTVANSDVMRHIRLELNRQGDVIRSAAKTGALGLLAGIQGRRGGTWRCEFPFQLSGAAGTAPDMDPILQAVFGAAPTIVASTSVTYALADVIGALTLWSYRSPAGAQLQQRVGWGAIVDEFEISSSDGELVCRASGPLGYLIDSVNFASYDSVAKAGATSIPAEPASPTFLGNIIPGFVGSATIDGTSTFKIESFSIRGRFNRALRYPFASYYPTVPVAGVREITCSFRVFEEDVAALNATRLKQHSKAAFDISLVFGDTAGYIATFALNNVIIPGETLDDTGAEFIVGFSDAPASMTSTTSKDELTLALT